MNSSRSCHLINYQNYAKKHKFVNLILYTSGHHTNGVCASGFCWFNNAAIAAAYAVRSYIVISVWTTFFLFIKVSPKQQH